MKNSHKLLCLLIVALAGIQGAFAQSDNGPPSNVNSENELGFRLGVPFGLTFKKNMPDHALEFIVGVGHPGFGLTVLYELQTPVSNVPNLFWVYGIGGHAGVSRGGSYSYYGHYYRDFDNNINYPNLGVDGTFGIEYKITEIPFTIGVDIKPYVDILSFGFGFDGALSFRYRF